MRIKENEKIKQYLYMLVGKELTRQDYEKILDYFNRVKQEKEHYKNKTLNNLYMKDFGGEKVFCLEDDKETYRDMIFELQERIDRAIKYIENHQLVFQDSSKKEIDEWFKMFYKELLNILKGSDKE